MEQLIPLIMKFGPWLGGAIGGVLVTLLTSRRAVVTYTVTHQQIGLTANDQVHGQVEVRYRGNVVQNLYLSVVHITNRSIKDLENLAFKTYRAEDNMNMLTEEAHIDASLEMVDLTKSYFDRIVADAAWEQEIRAAGLAEVPENAQRLRLDTGFRHGQRHYTVPVLNRGQVIKLTYLTTVVPGSQPVILVDCQSKGVRIRFKSVRQPAAHLWGVPVVHTAQVGLPIAAVIAGLIAWFVPILWVAAGACFLVGVLLSVPGALAIKVYQWLRKQVVG